MKQEIPNNKKEKSSSVTSISFKVKFKALKMACKILHDYIWPSTTTLASFSTTILHLSNLSLATPVFLRLLKTTNMLPPLEICNSRSLDMNTLSLRPAWLSL